MEIPSSFFTFLFSSLVVIIVIFILLSLLVRAIQKLQFRTAITKNLNRRDRKILFIKTPPTNQHKEDAMEECLRSLHQLLPNDAQFSLEMVSKNQFLSFYIALPAGLKGIIEPQIYAQYPDAEIEEVEDYLPHFDDKTEVVQLYFKRSSIYPFNTYHRIEEGMLKNLSAILSKTESDEKVFIQLVLKRVGSKFYERNFAAFSHTLFSKQNQSEEKQTSSGWKLSQDIYLGKLRIAYTAKNTATAKAKLTTLLGIFKSTKSMTNELKKKKFTFESDLKEAFCARTFENGDLWSPAELATIYHFLYTGTIISNVVHTASKRAPAPDILPVEGLVNAREVSFIGETNYRNDKKKFGIKRIDRRRHLYVVGKTGSGKSRLLELLLISDIRNGQGCCLLDPHGDLVDELLKYVSKERVKDVVYVNPSDRDFPIGFNPLEPVSDFQMRQHLSTFFIAIFKKLLAFNWNARMEHLMRYITLALLETPDSSVLGIQRILSDTTFRQRVIKQIQDPVVKGFWLNDFSGSNQQFISEAVIPILNKVGQFTSNPIVRNMIGQRKNMLDFESFMNEGKIVLMNISKGKLGDENAALLGSMFITKIQQAALARAKMPEEARKDFYFYVDEFQNFATDAFSSILSEARKYHLDLAIAHQYIAQLPEDVKATALGNVGTIITFAIGGDDAAYLAKEFSPTFTPDDMINLNTREMYIKMSIDGKVSPPFSARTLTIPAPSSDFSRDVINHSRMTYGKNRVAVENEIKQWSSATELVGMSDTEEGFPEPLI